MNVPPKPQDPSVSCADLYGLTRVIPSCLIKNQDAPAEERGQQRGQDHLALLRTYPR
jgi:hypothetical protein